MIKIKLENKFKLYDTVTCGQIFRFYELDDNSFDIILSGFNVVVPINLITVLVVFCLGYPGLIMIALSFLLLM